MIKPRPYQEKSTFSRAPKQPPPPSCLLCHAAFRETPQVTDLGTALFGFLCLSLCSAGKLEGRRVTSNSGPCHCTSSAGAGQDTGFPGGSWAQELHWGRAARESILLADGKLNAMGKKSRRAGIAILCAQGLARPCTELASEHIAQQAASHSQPRDASIASFGFSFILPT